MHVSSTRTPLIVPRPRHRSRRARRVLHLKLAGLWLACLAVVGSVVYFAEPRISPRSPEAAVPFTPAPARVVARPALPPDTLLPLSIRPPRVTYPYSVVRGGVHSRDELLLAVETDPVVAAHYAAFDVANARVVRLNTPIRAHMSYRLGDRVFWTKEPRTIPAGEFVLTDGLTVARTRCANRLSERAGPVSTEEPAEEVFDTPESLPLLEARSVVGLMDLPVPLPLAPGTRALPPLPNVPGTPTTFTVVQVPEPGTALLLLAAGGAFALRRLFRGRRPRA